MNQCLSNSPWIPLLMGPFQRPVQINPSIVVGSLGNSISCMNTRSGAASTKYRPGGGQASHRAVTGKGWPQPVRVHDALSCWPAWQATIKSGISIHIVQDKVTVNLWRFCNTPPLSPWNTRWNVVGSCDVAVGRITSPDHIRSEESVQYYCTVVAASRHRQIPTPGTRGDRGKEGSGRGLERRSVWEMV